MDRINKKEETRKEREKLRKERAKNEVILTATAAPQETKKSLSSMPPKDITEHLQQAIDAAIPRDDKPKLYGISRMAHDHIRFRCDTEQHAELLKTINWETAFEGLSIHKPKYGIVIHGVPKDEFNIATDA